MAAVTPHQIDGTLLASGTPTHVLNAPVAVDDFLVVELMQGISAPPGALTDNLGNTYQQRIAQASGFGALGYGLYTCRVTAAGTPTLTFHLAAAGAFGMRGYTNVSTATDSRGRSVALSSMSMSDGMQTRFSTGGSAQSVGDLVVAFICTPANVAFTLDAASSAGWVTASTVQQPGVSLQLLHVAPADTSQQTAIWTTPSAVDAITSGLVLTHS